MFKERGRGIAKLVLTGMLTLIGIFLFTGCGTLQTLLQNDGSSTLGGWIGAGNKAAPAVDSVTDSMNISLYFPDATGRLLIKEERSIPKTVSVARETVSEWVKGPVSKGALAVVPPATILLDIAIKDGIATVDLSKEFMQYNAKVAPDVVLSGLTNTLTQFTTVKEVKIRVEGKPLAKLGSADATHLVAKPGLVKGVLTAPTQAAPAGNGASPSSDPNSPNGGSSPNSSNGSGSNSPSTLNLFAFPPKAT